MSDLGSLAVDIPETPPVRQGSQEWPRVFVETIVVPVLDQPGEGYRQAYRQPMLSDAMEQRVRDAVHVYDDVTEVMSLGSKTGCRQVVDLAERRCVCLHTYEETETANPRHWEALASRWGIMEIGGGLVQQTEWHSRRRELITANQH